MPSPKATDPSDADRRLRFDLKLQRTRLSVHLLAAAIGVAGKLAGLIDADYLSGVALLGFAVASALVFHELYRAGAGQRLGLDLTPLWMACDVFIVTTGVYLTGGIDSPWYLFYLSNTGAAAFVLGTRGALAVGSLNFFCYLALLTLMGDVTGFDETLWRACMQLGFVYVASVYFLRGVSRLQESQHLLRQLQQDQALKVEELINLTQDLDQGTRALAEANLQIREADRIKGQFLANMSHELRTPLNSIIGFSDVLLERLAGQVPPKQLKFLSNINSSGQHLLGIINDILDLSKVEAGHMELFPEDFAVAPVVDGVLNVMHGVAGPRRITFEVDCPPDLRIHADPAKFKQVLYNLLSNAVKFSPDGSLVRVVGRLQDAPHSLLAAETVCLEVADQGIGIAPADQEVIFHEFRQVDGSATRAFGGTGLGLALVRRFVEFQGGRVLLKSAVGQGSTFTVLLPRHAKSVSATAVSTPLLLSEMSHLPGANRVLVVEDDVGSYQSLARALSEAGYFPIRARQGDEALEMARRLRPTAITLDLSLPGMSGWDVLREIKKDAATCHLPVVIVSMMDSRELGLTLGAEDYFVKPVEPRVLIERLRQIAPLSGPQPARRILLVDDDPEVHELVGDELSRQGFVVDHALSGTEGLRLADRERPDAIVLDLMMEGMSGFEVAAALNGDPGTAHVPIVVLTAKDLSPDDRVALQGRIASLVQKGQSVPARLVAAIRELESRHAREAARVG
jgi:signal transduction histidine kinase/DNA-binding response OmpR family regulator